MKTTIRFGKATLAFIGEFIWAMIVEPTPPGIKAPKGSK
jgi:hypothetical protein